MASLSELAKRAEKFTFDNSPFLLTAVGAAGVLTTAVLTARATFKAAQVLDEEKANRFKETRRYEPIPATDAIKLTWMYYVPAAGSAILTCGAVVGANQISTRRAAALAAAYSISEKAIAEYKDKVAEKFGEVKAKQVVDEVQKDRINNNPPSKDLVILSGKQLCFDSYSGRYFESDMESLKKAMNDLNYKINTENYASLNDFYDLVGLDRTTMGEEVGWSLDKLMDIHFTTTLSPDGRPAISMDYTVVPTRGYFRHSY